MRRFVTAYRRWRAPNCTYCGQPIVGPRSFAMALPFHHDCLLEFSPFMGATSELSETDGDQA